MLTWVAPATLNFAPAQALTHYRCQTADPLPTASPG
ncbi:Uncharacterised protein [Klebsiella pneumoniae]|nr:Uncharacterised protein [Klebsiella pneumoniae]